MNHLRLLISADPLSIRLRRSKCVRLLHPRTGKKCIFIVSNDSGIIFELQKINLPKRSLFIGNQISRCGDIFVLSPINPVFLFLPALLKMDKFTTLDVLIRSDVAPGFPELFSDFLFDKLCSVCDSKETCGLKVLRLNDEKLINWLKSGVDRICEAAREIIHPVQSLQLRAILSNSCGDSAVASFYAESVHEFLIDYFLDSAAASALTDGNLDTSAIQNLAFQIVADKLPGQFIDKLLTSLGLVTISNVDKGNIQEQSVVAKKPRFSNSNFHGPTLDCSKRISTSNPASTQSTARAKLLKKAQGSKSLMSFFGKK